MADSAQTTFRLPERTRWYLDQLKDLSTYGDSRADVIRRFIDEGIRRAQAAGDLPRPALPDAHSIPE